MEAQTHAPKHGPSSWACPSALLIPRCCGLHQGTRPFPHHLKASQNSSSESKHFTASPRGPESLQFHSSCSGQPCPCVPCSGLCVPSSGGVSNHVMGWKSEGPPCLTKPREQARAREFLGLFCSFYLCDLTDTSTSFNNEIIQKGFYENSSPVPTLLLP